MSRIFGYFNIVLTLSILVGLTACEKTLSGHERDTVLGFSEPAVDNLFAGLATSDYTVFSRDFDADMQEEIAANEFLGWKQDLDSTLGNYISRTVDQVTRADEFYVVTYQAAFEQEDPVKVTVAFHVARPHSITFLAFDSEKGSWSAFQQRR